MQSRISGYGTLDSRLRTFGVGPNANHTQVAAHWFVRQSLFLWARPSAHLSWLPKYSTSAAHYNRTVAGSSTASSTHRNRVLGSIVSDSVTEAMPNAEVSVEDNGLTLVVQLAIGTSTCDLHNAWREARDHVDARPEIVKRFVDTLKSTITRLGASGPLNIEEIVPLIKSRDWLAESDQQGMSVHREALVADLFVVYAEDGESQLRFVNQEQYKLTWAFASRNPRTDHLQFAQSLAKD